MADLDLEATRLDPPGVAGWIPVGEVSVIEIEDQFDRLSGRQSDYGKALELPRRTWHRGLEVGDVHLDDLLARPRPGVAQPHAQLERLALPQPARRPQIGRAHRWTPRTP